MAWWSIKAIIFAFSKFILWAGLLWSTKITWSASDGSLINLGSWAGKIFKAYFVSLFNSPKRQGIILFLEPLWFR